MHYTDDPVFFRRGPMRCVGLCTAQAVIGTYVGSMLFFFILYVTSRKPTEATFTVRDVGGLLFSGFAGVLFVSWWIVPLGVFFGGYLQPRIRNWRRRTAWLLGAALGAALGLATAGLFSVLMQNTPREMIVAAWKFVPIYCGVWCAIYSQYI